MYDVKLSQPLNVINYSHDVSRVSWLEITDISCTISVPSGLCCDCIQRVNSEITVVVVVVVVVVAAAAAMVVVVVVVVAAAAALLIVAPRTKYGNGVYGACNIGRMYSRRMLLSG
jgi:hypothetical protein